MRGSIGTILLLSLVFLVPCLVIAGSIMWEVRSSNKHLAKVLSEGLIEESSIPSPEPSPSIPSMFGMISKRSEVRFFNEPSPTSNPEKPVRIVWQPQESGRTRCEKSEPDTTTLDYWRGLSAALRAGTISYK